jgi:hypothetical protein
MHNIVKLLAKILATRLAPHLDRLVSYSKCAFIKERSIYDNFQYVKRAVNHFHHAKMPMLLHKLDIYYRSCNNWVLVKGGAHDVIDLEHHYIKDYAK